MAMEPLTGFETVIEGDHAYVHAGKKFGLKGITANLTAVSGTLGIILRTPAASTKTSCHIRPPVINPLANTCTIDIYPDIDLAGAPVKKLPYNLFDNLTGGKKGCLAYYQVGVTVPTFANGRAMCAATAGGNFANQPTGDSVEVVSSSASDVGIIATIYGTKTGATTTVTTERVTLNGTTAVASTTTTWQNILGVEIDKRASGTITFREGSADAAITTITSGNLSAGIVQGSALTRTNGYGQQIMVNGHAAGTAPIGVIGIGTDGTTLDVEVTAVKAQNGSTMVTMDGEPFRTLTKLLIGAVANTVNITAYSQIVPIYTGMSGLGGPAGGRGSTGGATEELLLGAPATNYLFVITNVGATTATTVRYDLVHYEENYGG